MLIMQGKLEDSDNRIQSIKQIHDQQNKKIKQIDQEKVIFESNLLIIL